MTTIPTRRDMLIKSIPIALHLEYKHFCETHSPPVSMRWVVISLIEKFVVQERKRRGITTAPKAPKEPTAPKVPKARKIPAVQPVKAEPVQGPMTDPPDLADSF